MTTIAVDVFEAEEGGYTAEVPAMPGCVTEADDLDGLVRHLWEAIEGWTGVQTGLEATRRSHELVLR